MKKLLLVLAVAVVSAPLASAGGWATVGLSSLPPTGLKADQPWGVDVTVLQHGRTPLAGVTPVLRVRDDGGKVVGTFRGAPTKKAGVYHVVARFPSRGTFSYEVFDGFTTYGGAQTHTFEPVTVGGPGGALPDPIVGIAAGLAAVGLAVASTVLLRRRRPAPEPATLTKLKEAA